MTTINHGTVKLTRKDNIVTVEVICDTAAEADAIFDTLLQTIREEKRLELTFTGLSNEKLNLHRTGPLQ